MTAKIRVLVVDDSAVVRGVLSEGLAADPEIEVIATARDPYHARDIVVRERPDVITLDIEMPRMDGVTFLKHYMRVIPTPTIIISALSEEGARVTLEALEAGAVDFITKPRLGVADRLADLLNELTEKVKMAARVGVSRQRPAPPARVPLPSVPLSPAYSTEKVVALGCSTGGTQALARLLPQLPPTMPGLAIVQHMPAGFTASLAQRLDALCSLDVREAKDGEHVRPGLALLAPGGERQMTVVRSGGQYVTRLRAGPKVQGHCPSVDALFHSIAAHVGANAIAVLMTGMGRDGAQGLLAIRASGGRTFVQDAATSVVWGMPAEGWRLGAAEAQLGLDALPAALVQAVASSGHPIPSH